MGSSAKTKKRSPKAGAQNAKSPSNHVQDSDKDSDVEGQEVDDTLNTNEYDSDWSSDADHELVVKVKERTKANDKVNYKTRLTQFDWSEIAFKNHSSEDCKKRFKCHLRKVRRYRTFYEVVTDVETNIKQCPIKKPLNSYQLFIQDQLTNATSSGDFSETMKNLAMRYKQLSDEERTVYSRKAEVLRNEYVTKKREFLSTCSNFIVGAKKTPKSSAIKERIKTPLMLYSDDCKANGALDDPKKLREAYGALSYQDKYKWILKAVSESPEANVTMFLAKDEQRIFKGQMKPTPTAYSLFVKEAHPRLRDQCDGKTVFKEIANEWKQLTVAKKKHYTDAANVLKQEALKEIEDFNERHGVGAKKSKRPKQTTDVENTESEMDEFKTPSKANKKRPPTDSDQLTPQTPAPSIKRKKISFSDEDPVSNTDVISGSPSPRKTKLSVSGVLNAAEDEFFAEPYVKQELSDGSPSHEMITPDVMPPMTVIHALAKSPGKKRRTIASESAESTNGKLDSDADASSQNGSGAAKKKSKKSQAAVDPPPPKPPTTVEKYFKQHVFTGKAKKAQKAFDKLSKKELKRLQADYNDVTESYVNHLKKYLASLPRAEAKTYIAKIKAEADADNNATDNHSESQASQDSQNESALEQ